MKITITAFIMVVYSTVYSQVGVGTVTPQSDLHVAESGGDDGSIQIDGGIRLGGDDTTQGSKGTVGQVLVSNGPAGKAEWKSIGADTGGGYMSNCGVPNNIVTISGVTVPSGSGTGTIDVNKTAMQTALSSLPAEGGYIVIRTSAVTTYAGASTHMVVELPIAANNLNKPFVIVFDGPSGNNNLILNNKTFIIFIKDSENGSKLYTTNSELNPPRVIYDPAFGTGDRHLVTQIDNDANATENLILYNSSVIMAVGTKTWMSLDRDCYVINPKF